MNDNEESDSDEIVTTHVHAFGDHEFHVDDEKLTIAEEGSEVLSIHWAAWDVLVERIEASRASLCPTQPVSRGRSSRGL